VKHFGNNGGSIINIGSMSSERFSAGAVAYTASKAGITGVTGVLAVQLASRGIRVNQINPGAVDTEGARAIGAMSEEARAAHIARTPLGRVGTPDDIASVAVFLAAGIHGNHGIVVSVMQILLSPAGSESHPLRYSTRIQLVKRQAHGKPPSCQMS
jgi:NAD(P)-dependent dehydrogenase (short-subunit alcohol dehydrogenase family)